MAGRMGLWGRGEVEVCNDGRRHRYGENRYVEIGSHQIDLLQLSRGKYIHRRPTLPHHPQHITLLASDTTHPRPPLLLLLLLAPTTTRGLIHLRKGGRRDAQFRVYQRDHQLLSMPIRFQIMELIEISIRVNRWSHLLSLYLWVTIW